MMTFADLVVGDHFIWPFEVRESAVDSINVNIKIASGEDGGGFAIDLATRKDCIYAVGTELNKCELEEWIPGNAPVIKLNGSL